MKCCLTNHTADANTMNVAALNATVHGAPMVRASSEPSNGPMIRPAFHEYTPNDTMAISSSAGTRSGNIAE